ncbi:hypothetical protein JYB87_04290 [Shewanella avicenniae]|uniref:Ankyrin repeats (3 copies) n=1 Tax=Shewanella avicenniae TaxID=2814294 RepID=A0ABX7QUY9_9GAMM|nr:hypothetical protein [Shewanella avicenniae]QSX34476.1 hypothetical protein JYB87_04290 [Shewanella avicenniae]
MRFTNKNRSTPYPTAQSLLREIANAFDTKSFISPQCARKLDDACKKTEIHIGEFEDLKELTILAPIRSIFGDEIWARTTIFLRTVFREYFEWIKQHPLDGLSVEQANEIFQKTNFFSMLILSAFGQIDNYKERLCMPSGIDLILLREDTRKWLWSLMNTKEAKDRVFLWGNQRELPSLKFVEKLNLYSDSKHISEQQWLNIKWGVICSRFVLNFSPDKEHAPIDWEPMSREFKLAHSQNAKHFLIAKRYIKQIFEEIRNKCQSTKSNNDKAHFEQLLAKLKQELDKFDPRLGLKYAYHQFNAHHLVLNGQLKAANNEYKRAFEEVLYRGHSDYQIEVILNEALLVAAYQERPDKVFINRLKSAAILLGLDYLPARREVDGKNKIELLAGNEIADLRVKFSHIFTNELAYPGVIYPEYPIKAGLLIDDEDVLTNNLDKKKITVGIEGGLQRKTTPLIVACADNNVSEVTRLLNEEASVNALSEVNDSPLLMSLTQMDFTDHTSPMDSRIFEMISVKAHSDNILNAVSVRKMNFPLLAAVETGNPDIVKKVLSMSNKIEIDLRGGLDWITPLYHVLGLIGKIKKIDFDIHQIINNPHPENIHRLKPIFAGMNKELLTMISNGTKLSDRHKQIFEELKEILLKNYPKSPAKLRQIARMLINRGADVNKEHSIKGMNYTPLMLAVENDELNLFRLMLEHGGDWRKVYVLPDGVDSKNKAVNCLDIAKFFKANQIGEYIENLHD